jgi:hypothetical protein
MQETSIIRSKREIECKGQVSSEVNVKFLLNFYPNSKNKNIIWKKYVQMGG